jgi:hypothetical protein
MPILAAALVKCLSSATARKYRMWRSSIVTKACIIYRTNEARRSRSFPPILEGGHTMMMNRRVFSTALANAAAASLISARGMAANSTPAKAGNVVLVHGLFADGSSWSEVIPRLQAAGLNVTSVQNPLTTLPEAVDQPCACSRDRMARRFWSDIHSPG